MQFALIVAANCSGARGWKTRGEWSNGVMGVMQEANATSRASGQPLRSPDNAVEAGMLSLRRRFCGPWMFDSISQETFLADHSHVGERALHALR
jgi:hypothetical protein